MTNRPRHMGGGTRDAAERAFRAATTKPAEKPAEAAPKPAAIPNAREMVALRLDREVLERFQQDGSGWQERINEALRKALGL